MCVYIYIELAFCQEPGTLVNSKLAKWMFIHLHPCSSPQTLRLICNLTHPRIWNSWQCRVRCQYRDPCCNHRCQFFPVAENERKQDLHIASCRNLRTFNLLNAGKPVHVATKHQVQLRGMRRTAWRNWKRTNFHNTNANIQSTWEKLGTRDILDQNSTRRTPVCK